MPKNTRYKVYVPEREMAVLLDMLRYEGATVVDWERSGRGYNVTLVSPNYTPARWDSFMMRPEVI